MRFEGTSVSRILILSCVIAVLTTVTVSIGYQNATANSARAQDEIKPAQIASELTDIWLAFHGLKIEDLEWVAKEVVDSVFELPPDVGKERGCEIFGGFMARMTGNYASTIPVAGLGTLGNGFVKYSVDNYPRFEPVRNTQESIKQAAITIENNKRIIKDLCIAAADETGVMIKGVTESWVRMAKDYFGGSGIFGDQQIDNPTRNLQPLENALNKAYNRTQEEFESAASKLAAIILEGLDGENRDPIAQDDRVTISQGERRTISVLGNDSDPDQDSLTIKSLSNPSRGNATITNGNEIVFNATTAPSGSASFTYTVADGRGGTDSARVHVEITAQPGNGDTGPSSAQGINLVAAIDVSDSVCQANNLSLEIDGFLNAVRNVIVPFIERGGGPVKLAIVSFSDSARTRIQLTNVNQNLTSIESALNRLKRSAQCSGTNMTAALNQASQILDRGSAGRSVVNLITDGKPNNNPSAKQAAASLKDAGHELWTLGVGSSADNSFLSTIAGPNSADNTAIESFKDLKQAETEKLGEILGPDLLASFEDLLKRQADLISSFTDLLETQPLPQVSQLERLNNLLTLQSDRLASFSSTLLNRMSEMSAQRTEDFLMSLEDLLVFQANLLKRFASLIGKKEEYPQSIVASLEEMIRIQSDLLTEFENATKRATGKISFDARNQLIKSFDQLIRLQDELLQQFHDLISDTASQSPPSNPTPEPEEPEEPDTTLTATLMSMTIDNFASVLEDTLPSSGAISITFQTPNGPIRAELVEGDYTYSSWGHRLYLSPGKMTLNFRDLRTDVTSVTITGSDWAGSGETDIRALDGSGNVLATTTNESTVMQETMTLTSDKPIARLVIEGESSYIGSIAVNN